jgi:hypothetical protein
MFDRLRAPRTKDMPVRANVSMGVHVVTVAMSEAVSHLFQFGALAGTLLLHARR